MVDLHPPVFDNLGCSARRSSIGGDVVRNVAVQSEILFLGLRIRCAERRNASLFQTLAAACKIDQALGLCNLKNIEGARSRTLTEITVFSGAFDHECCHS